MILDTDLARWFILSLSGLTSKVKVIEQTVTGFKCFFFGYGRTLQLTT